MRRERCNQAEASRRPCTPVPSRSSLSRIPSNSHPRGTATSPAPLPLLHPARGSSRDSVRPTPSPWPTLSMQTKANPSCSARWACSSSVICRLQHHSWTAAQHAHPDEIEFTPPTPPVRDILGGAGSYAALGARLFAPPPRSKAVAWIVDCGSDFPPALRETIASWETGALIRETPHRLTTRGWNGYGDNEHRGVSLPIPSSLHFPRLICASFPLHHAKAASGP